MLSILCVGQDVDLLRTRADVLRMTGAEVQYSTISDASDRIGLHRSDLIVLCHTIGDGIVQQIFESARRHSPCPLILLLTPMSGGRRDAAENHADAITDAFPTSLLKAVTQLLQCTGGCAGLGSALGCDREAWSEAWPVDVA